MNIKAAIAELDKIAEERRLRWTTTEGTNEGNMRMKVRDMRRILQAMQEPVKLEPYFIEKEPYERGIAEGKHLATQELRNKLSSIEQCASSKFIHFRDLDELFGEK